MSQTFYWHDYETWGIDPRFCQPVQFAGLRTDLDFNEIGDPLVIYSQPLPDLLPDPSAVLVTGITPQEAKEKGVPEPEFIGTILQEMAQPNTINVGYNSLRFDDEFTRYTLYRNLYDPYEREWANGNSRWDIIDLVRACRALRPGEIKWPVDEGKPTNRLERITAENGISHEDAHDALSDVRATIALAKLLKQQQPDLFEYAFSLRDKNVARSKLEEAFQTKQPLVHVTGKYPNDYLNTSVVAILGQNSEPSHKNKFVVYDLRVDPEQFLHLTQEELTNETFGREEQRNGNKRVPVKEVAVNKSPFIAPLGVLDDAAQTRTKIDMEKMNKNFKKLQSNPEFVDQLVGLFSGTPGGHDDVDTQLYGGFFSNKEKQLMQELRANDPTEWPTKIQNQRLQKLADRYRARHHPQTLKEPEQQAWNQHIQQRLLAKYDGTFLTFEEYGRQLQQLAQKHSKNDKIKYLLEELTLYGQSIYPLEANDD